MRYNPETQCLGKLCPKQHRWGDSDQSLLYASNRECVICNQIRRTKRIKDGIPVHAFSTVICTNCTKQFSKTNGNIKQSKNHFCSRSCAATYNNKHKTFGSRKSKLEQWLAQQLKILYPDLEIHYNRKDAIDSELDIYIPSLKLAFELNGVFHYEPIYGENKLKQIQKNDSRKFLACANAGISLCIIDTSKIVYCIPKNYQWVLDIVHRIIDGELQSSC